MTKEAVAEQAREIVRGIRDGTITFDTEEEAVAAIGMLVKKREYESAAELLEGLSHWILTYPRAGDGWSEHLIGDLCLTLLKLLENFGQLG
ncbi:hypothetical protein AB4Y67_02205 [Arthrobacter sp. YAF17]|uniref:hypothetical protein n=1 Tax=Arthrobacter sp. YAF17 TaxID=3233077 RepID=UPI003F91A485